jgi:hypothetical protein
MASEGLFQIWLRNDRNMKWAVGLKAGRSRSDCNELIRQIRRAPLHWSQNEMVHPSIEAITNATEFLVLPWGVGPIEPADDADE